jgi:DNA-binding response OmpR family regulator
VNEEQPLVMIVSSDKERSDRLNDILDGRYNTIQMYASDEFSMLYDIMCLKTRVVILDSNLPDTNMETLISDLQSKNVMTEFIVISEDEDFETSVQLLSCGIRDILFWSFDDDTISTRIDEAVEYIDSVSRLKSLTHRFFFEHFGIEIDLSNISSWAQKRRLEGDYITFNDLLDCMPSDNRPQELFTSIIKTKILSLSEADVPPTILVVEDDIDAQENIRELISGDYECLFANSIAEARGYCNSDAAIDIVLLDMHLPGGMGISLIDEFKAKNEFVEIIVVTAFKELDLAIDALKKGASDYFNKPYSPVKLRLAISKVAQRLYFKKYLSMIEDHIVQYRLPYKIKLYLLNVLCERKQLKQKDVLMSDVYKFFPELTDLNMSENMVVPKSVMEDGMIIFVEELTERLTKNDVLTSPAS